MALRVSASPGRLRQTQPRDFIQRFLFGALVTVAAGLIATNYRPVVGGLFLDFPLFCPPVLHCSPSTPTIRPQQAPTPTARCSAASGYSSLAR